MSKPKKEEGGERERERERERGREGGREGGRKERDYKNRFCELIFAMKNKILNSRYVTSMIVRSNDLEKTTTSEVMFTFVTAALRRS